MKDPGLQSTDCTGVQKSNTDIERSSAWTPTDTGKPTPLPIYPLPQDLPDDLPVPERPEPFA